MGDWWTPVVMREAFFGCRRFEQFQERLGVSRATLTERLARLVDDGLLEKVEYQTNPTRYEYRLTDKGRTFFSVLAAMWGWGSSWLFGARGPAVELVDRVTGAAVAPIVVDGNTGEQIDVRNVRVRTRRRPASATPD